MGLSNTQKETFESYLLVLLENQKIQEMNQFIQHGSTSCLQHSLAVAYYSYVLSLKLPLHLDTASLLRGALLHDFFLYDWHIKESHTGLHGFNHPKIALNNAEKYFSLTKKEKDIIRNHMWPLTPLPPHSFEAFMICFIDKYCSLLETFHITPSIYTDYVHSKN